MCTALNQCRQGTLIKKQIKLTSFKRNGFKGLYTPGNASTFNLAASVSKLIISPMSMLWIKLVKDLYGTILGISQFFIYSVFLFLLFFPLSLTTSVAFRILVYFFLLMSPPSYRTRMLLTLFLELFSYSWILVFTSCGIIESVQVFDLLIYSFMHCLGAVLISVVHIPSMTGLSGWFNIFFVPQWTGLRTSRVFLLLRMVCALESFSFSLDSTSSSLVVAGSLGFLLLTSSQLSASCVNSSNCRK